MSFFKSFGSKSKGDTSPRMEEITISAPEAFEHRSHVGWDAQNGFDVDNLPSEWKALFKNAGLKRKDLKDAETAKFVLGHIAEQLNQEPASQPSPPPVARRSPPPPVPSVASRRGTLSAPAVVVNEVSNESFLAAAPQIPARQRDSIPVPSEAAPSAPPPPARRAPAPAVPVRHEKPDELPSMRETEPVAKRAAAPISVSSAPPAPPPPFAAPAFDESFYAPPPPPPAPADASPRPSPRGAATSAPSLADQLGTVKLKKLDPTALPKLDQKLSDGLAGSLAAALASRRGAIAPTATHESDDDDDWDD